MTEAEELELLELEEAEARASKPRPDAGTPYPTPPEEFAGVQERLADLPPVADLRKMAAETEVKKATPSQDVQMGDKTVKASPNDVGAMKAGIAKQQKAFSPESYTEATRSFLGNATFNLADELGAAVEHPIDAAKAVFGTETPDNEYRKEQKRLEPLYASANKNQPGLGVVGAVAAPLPGVGKLKGLAKIAGVAGNAVLGTGLAETGASEKTLGPALKDAVPGMAKSALIGGTLGTVAAGAGKIAPELRSIADKRAITTAGGDLRDVANLRRKGMLEQIARALLDGRKSVGEFGQSVTSKPVLSSMSGPAGRYNKVQELLDVDGQAVGDAAKAISAQGIKVDMSKAANRLLEEVVDPYLKGPRVDQSIGKKLYGELEEINSRGEVPFQDALDYRRAFAKHVKNDSLKDAPFREGLNEIAGGLGTDLNAAASKGAPEAASKFVDANKRFGTMREIDKLVEKGINANPADGVLKSFLRTRSASGITSGADRAAKGAATMSKVADGQILGKYLASAAGGDQVEQAKKDAKKAVDDTVTGAKTAVSNKVDEKASGFLQWLLERAAGGQ